MYLSVGCILGIGGVTYRDMVINENLKEEIYDYSYCHNLTLEETAKCLRDYVSTFYNYTIRTDEERTIEDIKNNGGDCYDYNKLYERLGKQLGFDTFTFRINMGESYHRIAIISDNTGYCLLDQLHKINCFKKANGT